MSIENIELRHIKALTLLDNYDHQNIKKKNKHEAIYILEYDEAINIVKQMMFNNKNDLFGIEKDDSFKSSIKMINQEFNNVNLYESLEEKAANLLYLIVKNHSFIDGNKRIAAAIFLYYLYKNDYFCKDNINTFTSSELATLIIMISLSDGNDKELIVDYITNVM